MNAYRMMGVNTKLMEQAMERINSGYRINSAKDDASGLGISEKMRAQIRGTNQASANAQDAQLLLRTAEGQLGSIGDILQKMRGLAVKASDDSNQDVDREAIQEEMDQLATEITRISNDADHNNIKLLDGTFLNKKFQIGANAGQSIGVTINKMSATTLGVANATTDVEAKNAAGDAVTLASATTTLKAGNYTVVDLSSSAVYGDHNWGLQNSKGEIVALAEDATDGDVALNEATKWVDVNDTSSNLVVHDAGALLDEGSIITAIGENAIDGSSSAANANLAITAIDDAIKSVTTERSKIGAIDNRLGYTIRNLNLTAENLQAAESRIRDADVAKEMMEFMKYNILQQASMSMMSQANMMPQQVLRLLG